jgi:hypothetical protein
MNKDGVIFKDFGKVTTDTENRDESLKAYICAILDVHAIEFDDIIQGVKAKNQKEAFTEMIYHDIEVRIKRFFKEGQCL